MSVFCHWKNFCTRYFNYWCKNNSPCGLLVQSSAGAVCLVRKNSVSLFRDLENIEMIIDGTFDSLRWCIYVSCVHIYVGWSGIEGFKVSQYWGRFGIYDLMGWWKRFYITNPNLFGFEAWLLHFFIFMFLLLFLTYMFSFSYSARFFWWTCQSCKLRIGFIQWWVWTWDSIRSSEMHY